MRLRNPYEVSIHELRYRYADRQTERLRVRLDRVLSVYGGMQGKFSEIKHAQDELRQAEKWAQECFDEFMQHHPALVK